jgi:surfeit locus 1 family protein
MTRRARARLIFVACAALLCVLFLALGAWQVQRLQWKRALIAQVERRVHAAPVAAPARAGWAQLSRQQDEYRRVRLRGHFLATPAALVRAVTELGSGYWVLAPFQGDGGDIVLVNRGFIAESAKRSIPAAAAGEVTGLLRMSERGGGFLRDHDPAGERWYSRDVAAIAAARALPGVPASIALYFVDQQAAPRAPDRSAGLTGGILHR